MTTKTYDEIRNQSLDLVRQSQNAVVEGVRAWSEALGSLAPAGQATGWTVRPEEAVDAVFDVAEQTLATQRQVARQFWGAAVTMTESAAQRTSTAAQEASAAGQQASAASTRAPAETSTAKSTGEDYESMTVEELQDEAARAGVEGRSQMNKQELVKALRKHR